MSRISKDYATDMKSLYNRIEASYLDGDPNTVKISPEHYRRIDDKGEELYEVYKIGS